MAGDGRGGQGWLEVNRGSTGEEGRLPGDNRGGSEGRGKDKESRDGPG